MPWTKSDYPQSWKNMTATVRNKAIDIANALLHEGMSDERAIPIATSQAEAWADRHQKTVFRKTRNTERSRAHPRSDREENREGSASAGSKQPSNATGKAR